MRIDLRRIFVTVSLVALPVSYLLLYGRMLSDPVQATGADFIAFYAAGRIARQEGPARVYDVRLQQKYEEQVLGFEIAAEDTNPFPHPPFVIPLVQAAAGERYIPSFLAWTGMMTVLLILAARALLESTGGQFAPPERRLLLAGVVLFFPAFVSLINGQNSALLLLGGGLWLWGWFSGRDWLAGLGLAVMAVRPHLALPLALPFIFRRGGIFLWFGVGCGALALFSLAYVGRDGIEGFVRMLFLSGSGQAYHINENRMINFLGLLLRLFPQASASCLRLIAWIAYGAAALGLCFWWRRCPTLGWREAGTAVLLALFTAPHLHFHDLTLLLVPLTGLCVLLAAKWPAAAVLPLAASFALLFGYFSPLLQYSIPYLLMVFLLLGLWFPDKIGRSNQSLAEADP
ncbi:MAG: glycosyltransferase family 87 protein [Anaerolineales bacterium]